MAQKVFVQLVDDLDGTQISQGEGETVHFALDGKQYEIDLTKAHANELRHALAKYIDAGRSATPRGRRNGVRANTRAVEGRRSDLAEIREWARRNGHTVSDRGRVAQPIVEAYDRANGK